MKTIEDRLNEQLAAKDQEIERLRGKIEKLEQDLRGAESGWTIHEKLPAEQTLPVPRLEMVALPNGYDGNEWYETIFKYRLVFKALWGDVLAIPLGETSRKGGSGRRPIYEEGSPYAGRVDMPFRDGAHICHDMGVLKLPGFAICEDVVTDLSNLAGKPHERP